MASDSHRARIAALPALMALLLNRPTEVDQRHALMSQSDKWWTDDLPFGELFIRLHYWCTQIREDFEFDYTTCEELPEEFLKEVRSQYEGVFQILQSGAAQSIQSEDNCNGDPQSTVINPTTSMQ